MAKTGIWRVDFKNTQDQDTTIYIVPGMDILEAVRRAWKLDEKHSDHGNRSMMEVDLQLDVDLTIDDIPVDKEAELVARLEAVEAKVGLGKPEQAAGAKT